MEKLARGPVELSSDSPNIQIAPPKTANVIHPNVPAWTWVRSVFLGGSQTSMPFNIPITIVMTNSSRAARNRLRTPSGAALMDISLLAWFDDTNRGQAGC